MKTEFLRGLELTDEQIRDIQAESGKDVQAEKEKTREAEEKLKLAEEQREALEAECETLRAADAEGLKAEILRLQGEIALRDEQEKEKQTEEDLLLRFNNAVGENKFINTLTRDSIFEAFKAEALKEDAPADNVIYSKITRNLDSIYACSHPMVDIPPSCGDCGKIDESEVRAVMGLPLA